MLALVLSFFRESLFLSGPAYPVWRVCQHQIDGRQQRQHFPAVSEDQPAFTYGHFFKHGHSVVTFCLPTRRSSGTRRDKAASRPLAMRYAP